MKFAGNMLILLAFLLTMLGNSVRIGVCPHDNKLFIGECGVEQQIISNQQAKAAHIHSHLCEHCSEPEEIPGMCPNCHGCHNILLATDNTYEFTAFVLASAPAVPVLYLERTELELHGCQPGGIPAVEPWPPPDPASTAAPYCGHTTPLLS